MNTMCEDNLDALVHSIRAAQLAEQQHQQLRQQVQQHYQDISRLVEMADDQGETLYRFTLSYIREVPVMLRDLHHAATEAGLWRHVKPVMDVALAFFPDAPNRHESQSEIVALLHQAYLVHRLLEEVNESYIHRVGQPMVPKDMTLANVIVYTLIGDPAVYGLERLIEHSVKQVFSPQLAFQDPEFCAYLSRRTNDKLIQLSQPWPCMTAQLGMASSMLN
ncbi:hypothetical protein GCM10011297_22770 [Bacterioplanes sanyensis]|uniref:hypothetical protein n=1 Tax=Bacterioplanes sanyensis TaxID=1249553 RepID=UPI0016733074|nr:hypothetical protein [Bacterioplanes sanyensis]GGY49380.1 hypothetical protein GCM10011297_22770 [Bacterioplanes sanyensis]